MLSQINSLQLLRHDPAGQPNAIELAAVEHRYGLIGSASIAGDQFKLNAQLVHTSTGKIVWGDRYALNVENAIRLQEYLARDLVTALQAELTDGEHARLWSSGTANVRAWELFQRGRNKERVTHRRSAEEAQRLYEQALALDPRYLAAMVNLGFIHVDQLRFRWSTATEARMAAIRRLYGRAMACDPRYPETHALGAYLALLEHRAEEAVGQIRHAVVLAPGSSELLASQAQIHVHLGHYQEAIDQYNQALRVNPFAPVWICNSLAWAYRLAGRYEQAHDAFSEVFKVEPSRRPSLIGMTSILVRLNRIEDARKTARELLRVDPVFTVDMWRYSYPMSDEAILEEVRRDLRAAGLK
jgi:tetratricopeptide (TPR) repeat protein